MPLKCSLDSRHYPQFQYELGFIPETLFWNRALEYGLPEQNEFITYYYIFVKKDYDHAIRVSSQVLESDPLHVEKHWQLGLCYYFAGRFEEALGHFNNALELDQDFMEGYHWKGIVLGYLGQFERAMDNLKKARNYMQNQDQPNFDLLVVKIQMGQGEEVLNNLDPEAFLDPVNPAMLYTLSGYARRSHLMARKSLPI